MPRRRLSFKRGHHWWTGWHCQLTAGKRTVQLTEVARHVALLASGGGAGHVIDKGGQGSGGGSCPGGNDSEGDMAMLTWQPVGWLIALAKLRLVQLLL